ncbi:hypothetical protein CMK21_09265 [Candidatus Poribacteria bacterium]|nr:hypothetical protein [Candidatus Poribacteria bacterium]
MTDTTKIFEQGVEFIQRKDPQALNILLQTHCQLSRCPDPNDPSQKLIHHTLSYANFAGDDPSFWSTPECADVLLENGALVDPKFYLRALNTADLPMIKLLSHKFMLPTNMRTMAVLGKSRDLGDWFDKEKLKLNAPPPMEWLKDSSDPLHQRWKIQNHHLTDDWLITDAFRYAIRFGQKRVAEFLLEQAIDMNPKLAKQIKKLTKETFLNYLIQHRGTICVTDTFPIWEMCQMVRAVHAIVINDIDSFQAVLQKTPSLLKQQHITQQIELLELSAYSNGYAFAKLLLEVGAYITQSNPRPESKALVYAIDYGDREMVELLRELWEPPNDLPTLAGLGHIEKVQTFLNSQTDEVDLVHGLALACMNQHIEVADYLIKQGADINAEWSLHEPATILHHLAFSGKLEMVQFLVERGADTSIKDFRYQADALGWAKYNGQDQVMAYLEQVTKQETVRK